MKYEAKNYEHLLGLAGFSDQLTKNHFTLYSGYVANFNKLNDILIAMEKEGKHGVPEAAELNRRFGWEFNGMRLHEYYFENLAKEPAAIAKNSTLSEKINKEWGSYEEWEKDPQFITDVMRFLDNVLEDFIKKARELYLNRQFHKIDAKDTGFMDKEFDWAVCISLKGMIERELSKSAHIIS